MKSEGLRVIMSPAMTLDGFIADLNKARIGNARYSRQQSASYEPKGCCQR